MANAWAEGGRVAPCGLKRSGPLPEPRALRLASRPMRVKEREVSVDRRVLDNGESPHAG